MVASVPRLRIALLLLGASMLLHGAALAQPVTQPFTFSIVSHTLPHVNHGTIALGDVDGDGDLDVFVSGVEDDRIVTALFRNDGKHSDADSAAIVFEEAAPAFPRLVFGSAAWGDYDGDGDLDLVATGSRSIRAPYDPVSLLYRNDDGRLNDAGADLDGFHSGAARWGDYDNDGDLDLLLGGAQADGSSATRLYRNDDGSLVDSGLNLPGIAYGDAVWGDLDGDGELDLVMGGIASDGTFTDVFVNDGNGFAPLDAGMADAAFMDLDLGDFDGDGDQDVIQTGGQLSADLLDGLTRIYTNSGARLDSVEAGLQGALSGAGTWGDYDNDGDLDLFVMGAHDLFGRRTASLFANEAGSLSEKSHLIGVVFGSATWGDLDGDGDLDLITSGLPTLNTPFINIYENRRQVIPPITEPAGLAAEVRPGAVALRWDPPADVAASFNVRVGTSPGAGDVVSPMSNPGTGRRLLAAPGNARQHLSRTVRDLPVGTYYWSVQTVDAAFRGSRFAPEERFTISEATAIEHPDDVGSAETALFPVAPNPAAGSVTLRYRLAQRSPVAIRIHDMLGREVATLVDREQAAGAHALVWDGRGADGVRIGSGIYVCTLQSAAQRSSVTFVVAR